MQRKNIVFCLGLLIFSTQSLFSNTVRATFVRQIEITCGLQITKSTGSINFLNSNSSQDAAFRVHINDNKSAKVHFTNIDISSNIKNKQGYFLINSRKKINWDNSLPIEVQNEEVQKVQAKIDISEDNIQAGLAKVTTILELDCSQ